jgi:glyoxylase-like metal-dependent hydrolase (beta-lactamase superfamily II)
MNKEFASIADLEVKEASFTQVSEHCWAFTTEGDPNTGVIIGDDAVMIIDATATPVMARDVIARVRRITDKPIKYLVLSHYHAVRVLGASGYKDEGLEQVIASQDTYELIAERGQQDMDSEIARFPRLFQAVESIPGLTWPTLTFKGEMTLWLGALEVKIMQLGRGHTRGDTLVWVPGEEVLYSGDLVECEAACYTGDAYLADWPRTLERLAALHPKRLIPGRGPALDTPEKVKQGLEYTRAFVTTLYQSAQEAITQQMDLKATMTHTRKAMDPRFGQVYIYEHCLPFDVARAYDEASGIREPRIWTTGRDQEMWRALQAD